MVYGRFVHSPHTEKHSILREDMFTLARYKIVLCSLGKQSLYNSVHICSIALFQMPFFIQYTQWIALEQAENVFNRDPVPPSVPE